MHIIIVTQYFYPENFRINDLALGLRDAGHEVEVLTGMPNYPTGRFFDGYGVGGPYHDSYEGIPVRRVPLISRGRGSSFRLAVNYLSYAFMASLMSLCRLGSKVDLILVYEPSPITVGFPALVMKMVTGAPVMFWVQDLWPESVSATGAVKSGWILTLIEWMVRLIYWGCDEILVQSRVFTSSIVELGVKEDIIRYFPNSAEALYRPVPVDEAEKEAGELPDGFRIMFAGNIGAAQDFDTILDAAERLKDHNHIHWCIVGDGRQKAWVEEEVNRRGLSEMFHLLGRYPVEMMPSFFALADVMLVTLKKEPIFAFTVPAKVQSYLACGKPVIAALDGEGSNVISEAGAGLATPAEDAVGLAEAVLKMSRLSEDELHIMGQCGLDYFKKNFDRSMLIKELDIWMQNLIGKDSQ